MAKLLVNQKNVTAQTAAELVGLCPFCAISYDGENLEISSACKMCKMCVNKGPVGVMSFVEESSLCTAADKDEWRGVAVFVEHHQGEIHNITRELLGKARELADVNNQPVYAFMAGFDIAKKAGSLLRYGADKVFVYDREELRDFIIGPYAAVFEDFIDKVKPCAVLVGATNVGRSLAPRMSARFRTGLTADCTMLEMRENTDLVQIRPAFGGNIMAQILTPNKRPQFCTVRYKIFSAPVPSDNCTGSVELMDIDAKRLETGVKILSLQKKSAEPDISDSEVIVACGRGFKSKSDLDMAQEFAQEIGAQLAGTRPLIEAGWLDPRRQIGLSGRTVGAKLIVTLGISGSVQFAAGMRGCACIVAVNSDKNAPIFDIAHYGAVGDLYKIIPTLTKLCKEATANVQ
ncbi:MAG: FAD-binding protein [Oscillospiraceae bacterium]